MARGKKKAPKRKATRKPARGKKKSTPAATRAGKKKSARGRAAGPTTEVEKRWNEYWACRKDLEEAITEVRSARARLGEAQTVERERRAAFEETKQSLKQLLEVEPAAGSGPPNVLELERDIGDS